MRIRIQLILFLLFLCFSTSYTQILHTESFSVILDTAKFMKGSIVPDFKFQTQKKDLFEFENTADISFRFKKNALTFANKIELSKYGREVLLSGGFLYVEYRRILENRYVIEPFSQIHWSEARGLQFKFAGGINFRYIIYLSEKIGFYTGIGPFFEYERWNYDGVSDDLLPIDLQGIETEMLKLGTYLSLKWFTNSNIDFDISVYHQSKFNEIFSTPRLASSSSITFNFTEHLGLILKYQNIYDYQPVVPIEKLFNRVIFTIEVSF